MRHPGVAAASAALLLLILTLASPSPSAAAGETIGSIKNVSGSAAVLRGAERLAAAPGLRLFQGDILETGADGSLGLILRDDSLLSLGPSSRIALEKFVFVPSEGKLGLRARVLRGTMAFLSGLITRLAPESTTFVTPVATIGVRGTRFAVLVAE